MNPKTNRLPLEDLIHGVILAFFPGRPSARKVAPGQIGLAFGSTCEGGEQPRHMPFPGAALPHLYRPGAASPCGARRRRLLASCDQLAATSVSLSIMSPNK